MKNIKILRKIIDSICDFHDSHLELLKFKRLPARLLMMLWVSWVAFCN